MTELVEPERAPTRIYRILRASARAAVGLFYRHIEFTGLDHIDPVAPTILASTHPNSIVDPLLVGLTEARQVTFCARDGLFRIPVMGGLLRAIGAIAIRRRSDHAGSVDSLVDNEDAFAECRAVLARGGVITIFPEGKTHERLRVEPIKTGVARIAIDALRANPDLDLRIVPVGLNYLVREAFRSDVHVAVGPPIHVGATLEAILAGRPELAEQPRELVQALTDQLEDALQQLAIHIEEQDDERLIAQVTTLLVGIRDAEGLDEEGQSPAERTALVRGVNDAYRWLEQVDPIRCARLRIQLLHYLDERRALGLGGIETALQKRRERRFGREDHSLFGAIALVLGAPLALLGVAATILPYAILRLVLLIGRPQSYRVALIKLLGGTALFGGWFGFLVWSAWELGRLPAALAVAVSLVPLGLFAHRYVIDLRLYRFDLRKRLIGASTRPTDSAPPVASLPARLSRSRLLELRQRWLTRELALLRAAYLGERPPNPEASA